jgi:hypothetical protein
VLTSLARAQRLLGTLALGLVDEADADADHFAAQRRHRVIGREPRPVAPGAQAVHLGGDGPPLKRLPHQGNDRRSEIR